MEGNREVIWLRGLFSELKRPIQGPVLLIGDNKGVINTVYNLKHYNYTKYTFLKYQGVKKSVTKGNITIIYVFIGEIPADKLTKALTPAKHKQFLKLLNLSKPYGFQRGSASN